MLVEPSCKKRKADRSMFERYEDTTDNESNHSIEYPYLNDVFANHKVN